MNILTIATTILAIAAVGYVAVPAVRRALLIRKSGVPALPRRAAPPPLPHAYRRAAGEGNDSVSEDRRQRRRALGIVDDYGRPADWRD